MRALASRHLVSPRCNSSPLQLPFKTNSHPICDLCNPHPLPVYKPTSTFCISTKSPVLYLLICSSMTSNTSVEIDTISVEFLCCVSNFIIDWWIKETWIGIFVLYTEHPFLQSVIFFARSSLNSVYPEWARPTCVHKLKPRAFITYAIIFPEHFRNIVFELQFVD